MKTIYVERWESFTEFRGNIFKIDLEALAKEYEDPSILEMNEDELTEYLDETMIDLYDIYEGDGNGGAVEDYLSVVNQSDPDLETNYFMNKKGALDTISWRGFHRGDPDYNSCTWAEKQKKVEDLKKELEDNE
jgi:hypothetical protein